MSAAPSSPDVSPPAPDEEVRSELAGRCDTIEEAYEFMLAYAAQGLSSDQGSGTGSQIRHFLGRYDEALTGLGTLIVAFVERRNVDRLPYRAFIDLIDGDARNSQAAIRLVLAQPSISSQLIDNLNASIHLRALLTDLFLIDEILKS